LERFLESEFAFSETAEKLFFNIGRLALRQSRYACLQPVDGKSCRRAEKATAAAAAAVSHAGITH
jgi:hypothetical protein